MAADRRRSDQLKLVRGRIYHLAEVDVYTERVGAAARRGEKLL